MFQGLHMHYSSGRPPSSAATPVLIRSIWRMRAASLSDTITLSLKNSNPDLAAMLRCPQQHEASVSHLQLSGVRGLHCFLKLTSMWTWRISSLAKITSCFPKEPKSRALAAFPENQSPIPNTHMVAHNLSSNSNSRRSDAL